MEKQAAKGDFLRLGIVRLLLSFYWEQGALFFVLGLSAGHLCAKTVGGMLIQFSPGISRRLCYLCGMLTPPMTPAPDGRAAAGALPRRSGDRCGLFRWNYAPVRPPVLRYPNGTYDC